MRCPCEALYGHDYPLSLIAIGDMLDPNALFYMYDLAMMEEFLNAEVNDRLFSLNQLSQF